MTEPLELWVGPSSLLSNQLGILLPSLSLLYLLHDIPYADSHLIPNQLERGVMEGDERGTNPGYFLCCPPISL